MARVYPIYEKRLRDANALDFDDLLYWPALAMRHDAELRAELDARFRFVLIDEYQDTNHAQYAIARGLSVDNPNLCVVGDPDQSIYKFRGSDIRNILDFERDFPDARVLTLAMNYRSTKAILRRRRLGHRPQQAAQAQGPPHREPRRPSGHDPDLRERPGRGRGHRQAHSRRRASPANAPTAISPSFCASTPCRAAWKRPSSSDACRSRSSRGLAFFDRKENKDVLAYLRLLVNPRDDLSFLRVVNEPARGVGKVSLEHLRAYAEPRELSLLAAAREVAKIPAIKGKAAAGLRDFAALMTGTGEEGRRPAGRGDPRGAGPERLPRMLLDSPTRKTRNAWPTSRN